MSRAWRTTARAGGGILAAGVAGVAYASLIERNWFALRRFTVPALPAGARPIQILQVSDLHVVPGQRRKIEWVRGLAALEPDFVINSGDNLSHLEGVPSALAAMGPLMEFPGAFVLGSNDYYAPTPKNPAVYLTSRYAQGSTARATLPTGELVDGMRAGGWLDLTNAAALVPWGELTVDLRGVDDPHIARDDYAAVAGPTDARADLHVGLLHAPYQRVLDAMVSDGAELLIAGHTHGGQLAIPGYGALVTNCDLDTSRAKGMSRWWSGAGLAPGRAEPSAAAPASAAYLHVSAGLGTSRFAPVRFACRPEATLLTLVPGSA
ncbi:MAG: metallophosphoesterase [Phycicoccus sp.]|nr:metallophosphoesterase [Phycicoccus sp.]